MNEATLITEGNKPVLRFERHLAKPLETVWRAITGPDEMVAWFPTRIEIDEWKEGATITHHFTEPGFGPLPGVVSEWRPPHRVSFTWGDDSITFELTPAPGGGTIFVLTEELSAPHAARNAAGWDTCLDRLEFGEEKESWSPRFARYAASFEPVLGHQDGPPEGIDVS